jgi:hypothetical protein
MLSSCAAPQRQRARTGCRLPAEQTDMHYVNSCLRFANVFQHAPKRLLMRFPPVFHISHNRIARFYPKQAVDNQKALYCSCFKAFELGCKSFA